MADFDAIVVGSGISGGWAAKELTEKGLKVLLIERGRLVRHIEDYTYEHKQPWEMPFRGFGDQRTFLSDYPIQRRTNAFDEGSQAFFINDRLNPYQTDPETDFTWTRGDQLGGKSLTWGRYSMRYGPQDFTANLADGHGVDWPIRYEDLAPWYDHAESFAGISGSAAGLPHMPDGKFLRPMPLNCVEEHVSGVIKDKFDRYLLNARAAVLTEDHLGRSACHYCGPCVRGCSTASYFSTQGSTLPAAQATGLLTIQTDAVVERLDHDPRTGRVTGVRYVDTKANVRRSVTARMVFLNASTIASTHILLNSRSEQYPTGLGNRSDMLGRNLMDHVIGPRATGTFPAFADRRSEGTRPVGIGILIARFRNLGAKPERDFVRGYHYQGSASRQAWTRGALSPGIGVGLKTDMHGPGPWTMFIGGLGECLPNPENRVTIDDKNLDRWGIPQVRMFFRWSDNERKMAADIADEAAAMLAAAGATDIKKDPTLLPAGTAIHEAGTARMGRDPKTSVLNGHNQAHDHANLFLTDGSCLASSPNQNPSLTYMALTARACDFAVGEMKLGRI